MKKLLSFSILFLLCGVAYTALAQSKWVPSQEGLLKHYQPALSNPGGFGVNFKPKAFKGKDWIYGHWLDSDSLLRSVGYRHGGKWKPLPFYTNWSSYVGDIVQYGDTLYIGGLFNELRFDGDTTVYPQTTLLKYHNDSLWRAPYLVTHIQELEVQGDSLWAWASSYQDADTNMGGNHLLATQGATHWQYPYNPVHPTENIGLFGSYPQMELHKGSMYTLNDQSSFAYNGVARWDGQQWHIIGNGIYGGFSKVYDFAFYRDELYIGGSFTKTADPRNPGEYIAKWNGMGWEEVGGGLTFGIGNKGMFVHNDILYCHMGDVGFGDAPISYFAGWDGEKWCGTPINYYFYPRNYGFANDTLFAVCHGLTVANGDTMGFINYFDGDYLNGPNAICSTPTISLAEQKISEPEVQLYPNPAGSKTQLEILNADFKIYQLEIYNNLGQSVWRLDDSDEFNFKESISLDLSTFSSGIYTLIINETYPTKFVKE